MENRSSIYVACICLLLFSLQLEAMSKTTASQQGNNFSWENPENFKKLCKTADFEKIIVCSGIAHQAETITNLHTIHYIAWSFLGGVYLYQSGNTKTAIKYLKHSLNCPPEYTEFDPFRKITKEILKEAEREQWIASVLKDDDDIAEAVATHIVSEYEEKNQEN